MNDQAIEQEIKAKGLTAPRVTIEDVLANIMHIEVVKHISKSGQVLRWAVITAKNGFAITGRPSCSVSPENDNIELGEKIAIDNAKSEMWALMGYELRSKLSVKEEQEKRLSAAEDVVLRIAAINRGDESAKFSDEDLVYAATTRCACGAGMAYPKSMGPNGSWNCADVLTFRAAKKGDPNAVGHNSPLPFAFYEIGFPDFPVDGALCRATND